MPDVDKISSQVLGGKKMADVVGKFDWKGFEEIVSEIFSRNDFLVKRNLRFKTDRRWENDVLAVRGNLALCADCKRWSDGREKGWSLRKSAADQERRTAALEKFVKSNPIAASLTGSGGKNMVPVLVTLHDESVLKFGKTYVVPVSKLNTFLLNIESIV